MTSLSEVRLGVIGAGMMGSNHARVATRTPGIELVGIVEPDAERGRPLAASLGAEWLSSIDQLPSTCDGVVIATPTRTHHELAAAAIDRGLHVLIEKPMASTVEEGRDLAERARRAGVTLFVGHVERFNPAIRELMREEAVPVHMDLQRVGPFSPRVLDDVVTDLMIHDLDLARMLARSEVVNVTAIGTSTRAAGPELASALLRFANGVTATVMASRISQQRLRTVVLTYAESVAVADLARQDVMIHRMQHVEYVSDAGARIRQSGVVEIPFIESRSEPLGEEQRAFAAAIRGAEPAVSAEDGVAALELVRRVLQATRASAGNS